MAIYHLSAKIVSKTSGRSAVAAAAYRSSGKLKDESTGITHDYSRKRGVVHSEILAPENAPAWMRHPAALWNGVEAVEKRRDAQLARDIDVGLPVELGLSEHIDLMRDYVRHHFVARGMVADFSIHHDNPHNPHAHVLLTTRQVTPEGFGPKVREWNAKDRLLSWREGWAEHTNEHLARAGYAVRIDHRSYKDQGLSITPGRKIGISKGEQGNPRLTGYLADRVAEQRAIAQENGEKIRSSPRVALEALTHHEATFTHHDIARFLNTHTEGAEQFQAAYVKVTTSDELVALGTDDRNQVRFTTREMIALERNLFADAEVLTHRRGHRVDASRQSAVLTQHGLSEEQQRALVHITDTGDLKTLVGVAGSGKSRLLAAARETWEAEGYRVRGAALAGIAAENLEIASGIESRTLASYELSWKNDRDKLTRHDVLVIDEAGMVGTRQLGRLLQHAETAGAKVLLVGDHQQLQAIEAGAPFRGILARHGMAELTEVRRQKHAWQREATQAMSRGETRDALSSYEREGQVVGVRTREQARTAMIARWAKEGEAHPSESRLMLAYTREDVRELNAHVRALRVQQGQLGKSHDIQTERGTRAFAPGDRLYFLRNEKSLGVKNGSLGTLEKVKGDVLQIRLDGADDKRVAVDTRFYKDLDYGYAATVHKAQGSTVDRTYLLATQHYDRHSTYVGLSRHRQSATLFYAREDFGGKSDDVPDSRVHEQFLDKLSRAREKELVHDYLEGPAKDLPPEQSLGERFNQGFQRGKGGAKVAQSRSAAPQHDESIAGRFATAVEKSRLATLTAWQQKERDAEALEARPQNKARLEAQRAREREVEKERGKDYGR